MEILVVDDEPRIRRVLCDYLLQEGHSPIEAAHGREALEKCTSSIAAALIDVMMPEMDGWSLARELLAMQPGLPIIFLTARDREQDELFGLELGAKDYIKKPFSPKVVMARLVRLLQDAKNRVQSPSTNTLQMRIDRGARRLFLGDREVLLAPMEYALMEYFFDHPGQALSRSQILRAVWDSSSDVQSRTLDTHIKKLRKKLGPLGAVIETVRSFGYRLRQKE
jgi:two-component system response regulator ResD